MKLSTVGFARLTALVGEHTAEGVLAMVATRVAEGESPTDIARSMGMPPTVLRKWMEDSPERMAEWELAKRCWADGLVYEGLKEIREAQIETVGLAKLRNDAYKDAAKRLSKVEWGDGNVIAGGGGGNITIIIGSVDVPKQLTVEGEVIE